MRRIQRYGKKLNEIKYSLLSATVRNRNLNNGLISIYSILITTYTLTSNIKNGRENAKMKLVAILGLAELRMIVSASSFDSKTVV